MIRKQSGFTLIELVMVIVILGILSAFALPRFADLGGDARSASLEGAAGAMKSAKAIVRSACIASSDCNENAATGESVTLEGSVINLAFGNPTADVSTTSPGGIVLAAQLSGSDYEITTSGSNVVISFEDTASGECQITYTPPASGGAGAEISVDSTNC